jgi:hypothetical protein
VQPGLEHRRYHREGVASSEELFRRLLHASNFDQNLAQLRRITLLLAMIGRPRLLDVALRRIVLDDVAGPSDVPGIQKVRAEEAWCDNGDLDVCTAVLSSAHTNCSNSAYGIGLSPSRPFLRSRNTFSRKQTLRDIPK